MLNLQLGYFDGLCRSSWSQTRPQSSWSLWPPTWKHRHLITRLLDQLLPSLSYTTNVSNIDALYCLHTFWQWSS